MKIGIIGTGNMGNVLIDAFIESKAVPPENITITNRNLNKAILLKNKYNEISVKLSAKEVINESDLIFLCVKPLDIHPLLRQVSSELSSSKCLISITSPVSVERLSSIVNCQVARIIPSITNRALSGVTLITFGESLSAHYREYLWSLCSKISTPVEIEDNVTRVASDIVSCGPAFFSYLLQRFIDAAVAETEITKEQATVLASQMMIGMGELLEKNIFTLPTLQEKVCVKGGVTGEGIKVLESELGSMFHYLFKKTHDKYNEDIREVSEQFDD
ncbi:MULTISPECIES: late competence protein ComER [Bacillus]|uniref:late competence protein ComER n=1 Tax=Bacillus TaxID=1386 RepID=UPI000BB69838|nr:MULTISPECIES: late competence protein ComER [Bacillus]